MRRVALTLSAALLASACTVVGGSSHSVTSTSSNPGSSGLSPVRPLHAVLPGIERFVERERGLKFKHPVKVVLLSRKAFVAKLRKEQGKISSADAEEFTSTFAALGLISPRTDIAKAFRTAYDAGTLGFYSFKDKRLYVRGTRATPGVRAVLSHELTHALTDQWFGLNRPGLRKGNQELQTGFTALIEGDAERTRMAYEAHMSAADHRAADREEGAQSSAPKVPQIVLLLIGFPYAIGPRFVDAVVLHGGIKALNDAYRHPPVSSEQLLIPPTFFKHDAPKPVATPRTDGPRVDHGDLGLIGLLLMLEHGDDRAMAQTAVVGWGGDQYATWRAGNHRWCLRDTVVMDDELHMSNFDEAMREWVRASHGRAHVEQYGARTTFVTCSS